MKNPQHLAKLQNGGHSVQTGSVLDLSGLRFLYYFVGVNLMPLQTNPPLGKLR